MGSNTIINQTYRFVGGNSTEPPIINDDRTLLVGKPFVENSAMATVTTTGTKFLAYGDFSRFYIVDRIGLQIELIQHLFGASQRPTGQRGLFAYWRNSSKLIDANAIRVLIGIA
jgi:HK97 family phage major capsid protein